VRANGESSTRNADRIYDELRERILSLRIQPGAVIDAARIVSDMGTSRTPVREAIIRLVSEGLLRRDGRQTRVSAFDPVWSSGVRAMAIRLPQVHGADGKAGLITYFLEIARQKGVVPYVGDGNDRWPAAHRLDVARLYRLALEKGVTDGVYHAVAEEGVPMRQIVDVPGRALNVPVTSMKKEEAGSYFGPLAMFAGLDIPASSAKTQAELGWKPTEIGLIADISKPGYFKV
jgi:hypothetical protein